MAGRSRIRLQAAVRALNSVDKATLPKALSEARKALEAFAREAGAEELAPERDALLSAFPNRVTEGAKFDALDDAQLADFNFLLPWAASTMDRSGRLAGQAWAGHKRFRPETLGNARHDAFAERLSWAGHSVLEVGCFEGIHTAGLARRGAIVTAIDGRVENALKTLARLWLYGESADVWVWNLEEAPPERLPLAHDVLHHIGVLYHLTNPVDHLRTLLPHVRKAVLLDTHVAAPGAATESYQAGGRAWTYQTFIEGDHAYSPFAGMRDHAKWLAEDDLTGLIGSMGFEVEVRERRDERNGLRVMIWAFRPG